MARRNGILGPVLALAALTLVAGAIVAWAFGMRPPGTTTVANQFASDGWTPWQVRSDGTPVRWDPCTPIQWTTRASDPAWLAPLVADVASDITAVTGIGFRQLPPNGPDVGQDRSLADGPAWAPVVVTFTTPKETDWITPGDRGLAVPVVLDEQFVTGQVLLNATTPLTPDRSSRDGSWGGTILHELGHVVGLDHHDDPAQIMFPDPRPGPAVYGNGDQRGLAALGQDPTCLPPPAVIDLDLRPPARR